MNYLAPLGRVIGNLKGFYSGINGATLTGAIDVVVVEQEDGTFKCSPFHVRFGKLGVLRSKEKIVDIEVNGVSSPLRMKLGDTGEAFFVQEIDSEDELDDENLATSPLPGSPNQTEFENAKKEFENAKKALEDAIKNEPSEIGPKTLDEPKDGRSSSAQGFHGSTSSPNLEGFIKGEARKRRKKRRRNQGSKSDIKIELNDIGAEADANDQIFRMDEEISSVGEDLEKVSVGNLPHSRSYHRDFFSDTEIDPSTPSTSRPSTPIQSDSEYEITKVHKEGAAEGAEVSKWVWGELPSTGNTTPITTPMVAQGSSDRMTPGSEDATISSDDEGSKDKSGNKSMLAGMFAFMNRNKTETSPESGAPGIYLDDLNVENMDPEVAALYFPNYNRETLRPDRDEDVESGKGNSLPQSPAPGSSPKLSSLQEIMEGRKRNESSSSESQSKFEGISLCGNNLALFEQSQLTYDELVENPEVLLNTPPESIVAKIEGKYVPWSAALPQLLSTTFFRRPLPPIVYQKLVEQTLKKDDGTPGLENTTGGDAVSRRYSSWFPWRRSQASHDQGSVDVLPITSENQPTLKKSPAKSSRGSSIKETSGGQLALSPTSSSDESEGTGGQESKHPSRPITIMANNTNEKYKKTLRLASEQIASLRLHYGRNEAVFSVTTAYQGTTVARCHIYLWKYDDRIVISDIDGTITKSDVLGHILPIIGNDWSQSGVAQLFTQIAANGYKMLYLSARAIGQAQITREYLRSIRQGDVTLPDGPLLLNPTSLMAALHREVIEKKPEEFKIACLKDIQNLFPQNPFYAGYGNRINDVWSYRAVDINISRIFTINHKGELRHALTNTFQSSYTSLVELAEHIFPPYKSQSFCDMDGYGSFEFWRENLSLVPGKDDQGGKGESTGRPRSNTVV